MNAILNDIASSLCSKSFEECDIEELEAFINKYPFVSSAQLLLSQKLKHKKSDDYESQWQKTLLYLNDPLFAHHYFSLRENKSKGATRPEEQQTDAITEEVHFIEEKPTVTEHSNETATSPSKHEEKINIPALRIEAIDPDKNALTFTPYYTVDYFASQGIKFSETTNDKFAKQLKSFTEWLKEMRRLPEAPKPDLQSSKDEIVVEKMAEQSLIGENANTETMAEVWVKQGEPEKAIQVYEKLSLLIPAKSAYFAAKIDHLKKQK